MDFEELTELLYVSRRPVSEEPELCECRENDSSARICVDNSCFNVSAKVECGSKCSRERCGNQQLSRRRWADLEVRKV